MIKRWRSFFNPEHFQGWGKTKKYFEGWYFKIINADGKFAFAIIPGIAMDGNGNKHAFIQVLDGKLKTAQYFKFDADEFVPSPDHFDVRVGSSRFTATLIELHLPTLHGRIEFSDVVPWPKPFYSPGIMGPFAFVPFMECYHGIVSMDHGLKGILITGNTEMRFDDGRGYIEKDWGRSFPGAYIWMQTNHFSKEGISLKVSVAKIPWLKSSFVGFIAGLWLHGKLIRFTTYNSSHLLNCRITRDKVEIVLDNKRFRLEVKALRDHATALAAPILGMMDGRIEESMSAEIHVKLSDKSNGKLIFEDTGRHAAIEVAGTVDDLITS
ncbi:MAG: tocopherol cyclase family protein [Cyclobacteriaceae bacterium]|nr:tocopherol cyclase family protein [Cyclobacteriaceae bacterium]